MATGSLTKMSVKTLGCNPRKIINSSLESITLCKILGNATKVSHKETREGNITTGFEGTFNGINLESNEVSESSVLYLPPAASMILEKKVEAADGKPVEFAFEIRVVANQNSSVGYEYRVFSLIEPVESDPLEAMRKKFFAPQAAPETPKVETPAPQATPEAPKVEAPKQAAPPAVKHEAPKAPATTAHKK